MYKIKNKIKQIRKLLRWIPIIWNDRDWDQYYIYEILKQKLIDQEVCIRSGYNAEADIVADKILKAIEMIDIVQNEKHIDDYIEECLKEKFNYKKSLASIKKHDQARRELFRYLSDNIDEWWD